VDALADVASKLEARAATYVKENRLPGAAVGVVHSDKLAWWAGIGFADIASRRAPEPTTLYRIASITKTFTGTAIMRLRDAGKLRLDDPVGRHIPEVGHLEDVTIRRLLSHESGLQSEPPGTDWRQVRYEGSVERNLARASEITTRVPPNSQHKYSNVGVQLLGEVVARCSGMPYVDYVRTQLLEPIGMTNTVFEPLPDPLKKQCATGYGGRFVSDELAVAATPPTIWAEGGLWSCVEDLARWISYQFRNDPTLHEMHRPRYLVDEEWTEATGIAWFALRRNDVTWVLHNGGLHGFRSNVCFDPRLEVGAIALINGVGDPETLALDLAGIAREAVVRAAPKIEPPPPIPAAYRPLVGIYFDKELGATLRMEWRDGNLVIIDPTVPQWRPTLTPTEDPSIFLIEPGIRQSGENAVFNRLPDGRVASVFIAAGTWVRLDPVAGAPRAPAG